MTSFSFPSTTKCNFLVLRAFSRKSHYGSVSLSLTSFRNWELTLFTYWIQSWKHLCSSSSLMGDIIISMIMSTSILSFDTSYSSSSSSSSSSSDSYSAWGIIESDESGIPISESFSGSISVWSLICFNSASISFSSSSNSISSSSEMYSIAWAPDLKFFFRSSHFSYFFFSYNEILPNMRIIFDTSLW